jgi:acetoin utilization deacetylase AcuC-like enzyme
MTGIVADPRVKQHDAGPGHPEQPARFHAVINHFERVDLMLALSRIESRTASDDELALAHHRSYIELVKREIAQGRVQLSTGDTDICPASELCARLAAGSVLSAVDAVFERVVTNAFCVVRPPGHHANAARGMGFCLFNNVAIAARYAQQRYSAERVLIADWDVHHGNGTQDIFYEDGSVLFFSTHQSPWYPGTGEASEQGAGPGFGSTINCPFPAGAGGPEILAAFHTRLLPAAKEFKPDLVLLSAGFDSRVGDPLGLFRLADSDFAELTCMMSDLAADCCGSRLVSVLEGGYNLEGLARASEAHVRELLHESR